MQACCELYLKLPYLNFSVLHKLEKKGLTLLCITLHHCARCCSEDSLMFLLNYFDCIIVILGLSDVDLDFAVLSSEKKYSGKNCLS